MFSSSEMKEEDNCDVSGIWSSSVGYDISDEVLASLDIPDCSTRPETNVVNKDSLNSKGSTEKENKKIENKSAVQGEQ